MTLRNRETANIDQNRRAAMAGTPIDNDTVPEGEWVAGRRGVPPATAQDDVGQPVADFRDPLDADTAPASAIPPAAATTPDAAVTPVTGTDRATDTTRLDAPATGAHAASPPATSAGSGRQSRGRRGGRDVRDQRGRIPRQLGAHPVRVSWTTRGRR